MSIRLTMACVVLAWAIIFLWVGQSQPEDILWHPGDTDPIRIEAPTPTLPPGFACVTSIPVTSGGSTGVAVFTPCNH
jgi:hypothetical protein